MIRMNWLVSLATFTIHHFDCGVFQRRGTKHRWITLGRILMYALDAFHEMKSRLKLKATIVIIKKRKIKRADKTSYEYSYDK